MAYRTSANNPRQGSMFNEIIVNPTFLPDIARPYHLPGTPEFLAAQAQLEWQLQGPSEAAVEAPAALDPASQAEQPRTVNPTCFGGKSLAPLITSDLDWRTSLAAVNRPHTKLDTVCAIFDLDLMALFKNRPHEISASILDPDTTDAPSNELSVSTHVPQVDAFSADHHTLTAAANDIKARWSCKMNRFCLQSWASAVIAGKCLASDSPLSELVQTWTGGHGPSSRGTATPKPRGRSRPNSSISLPPALSTPTPSTSSDPTNILLTSVLALITSNLQAQVGHKRRRSLSPLSSPVRASSPIQQDELEQFFVVFGKKRPTIANSALEAAKNALKSTGFSIDVLADNTVAASRLIEFTNLSEGDAHALKIAARKWLSAKTSMKRSKY
ncbi:hypothetical protein CVT24_004158 [Panaeolus cyanescens]|uniref:Uncharacterized protein n=1 Tax=Panaeolus cyanescens TaxID=181874 RepID=A0A409Y6M5_9AGAR|nr:hypothetical protein CVT24_004158 [Panaeolus cyanescens]